MISAVSDGIMIAVILLVSVLVISSLLCIRFTLLWQKLRMIIGNGVMKAIGIRVGYLHLSVCLCCSKLQWDAGQGSFVSGI